MELARDLPSISQDGIHKIRRLEELLTDQDSSKGTCLSVSSLVLPLLVLLKLQVQVLRVMMLSAVGTVLLHHKHLT